MIFYIFPAEKHMNFYESVLNQNFEGQELLD